MGRQPGRVVVKVGPGDVVKRKCQAVVDLRQDEVFLPQDDVELLAEDLRVEQVLHAQADARRLVRIGGPDTAFSRAQAVLTEVTLGEGIQLLMVGHNKMSTARYDKARTVDASAGQRVHLVDQELGLDHDTVADHGSYIGVQDAAWHKLKGEPLAVDHDGVASVVAPLVAHNHLHLFGEQVGQFRFTLVTPLGAYYHSRRHASAPPKKGAARKSIQARAAGGDRPRAL